MIDKYTVIALITAQAILNIITFLIVMKSISLSSFKAGFVKGSAEVLAFIATMTEDEDEDDN